MNDSTASPTPIDADPATLGYEEARDELIDIVRRLESGQAPLEATLQLWERGEALAARCRAILDDAQHRLEGALAPTSTQTNPSGPAATRPANGIDAERA